MLDAGLENGGRRRGWASAGCGIGSAALLAAAIRWAHHWGPLADAIVAGWAVATVAALVISVWALRASGASKWAASFGVSLAGVSFAALLLAGVLWAAGVDTAGACGGG